MTTLPDTATEAGQREASVMLARLMGWDWTRAGGRVLIEPPEYIIDPYGVRVEGFYHPSCMQYAWRVLNWANKTKFGGETTLDQWSWWHNFVADMRLLPPAAAQRAWLDKILSLAIQAGMVQEN